MGGIDANVLVLQPARQLDQAHALGATELTQQRPARHLAHAVPRRIMHPRASLFPANSRCIRIRARHLAIHHYKIKNDRRA
jgi:hypothetical protein